MQIKKNNYWLFLIFFSSILIAILPPLSLLFMQNIIELVTNHSMEDNASLTRIALYLGLYVNTILFYLGLGVFLNYAHKCFDTQCQGRLYMDVFRRTSDFDYEIFEDASFYDSLNGAIEGIKSYAQKYRTQALITSNILSLVFTIVLFGITNWLVAIVAVVFSFFLFLISLKNIKRMDGFWGKYISRMRYPNYLSEVLISRNYSTEKKIFKYSSKLNSRYQDLHKEASIENIRMGKQRLMGDVFEKVLSSLFPVVILMLYVVLNKSHTIIFSSLIPLFLLSFNLLSSTSSLGLNLIENHLAKDKLKQLDSFLSNYYQKKKDNVIKINNQFSSPFQLCFVDVNYQYNGNENYVIKNLNICLDLTKKYALVGENGSGKSTFVKLMLGLLKPNSGYISLGGKLIDNYTEEEKSQIFSTVFQNFYRFPLSVKENIVFGKGKDISRKKINSVLDKLALKKTIDRLKDGIDTDLMNMDLNASNVSSGELQKIAIARSVLASSPFTILDEPNASLDPIVERQMYEIYEQLFTRGSLFISHRLGALKNMEEIIVLKSGSIEATGSHQDLYTNNDYYRELYDAQRKMYEDE
jgi:ATP-binding cassette subfamily B protein